MDLYAGFDLGGTLLKWGVLDSSGKVLTQKSLSSPNNLPELIILLEFIWKEITDRYSSIQAAGLGFPGIYSQSQKKIIQSPHCPYLVGWDLTPALRNILGVPHVIDNEANLAAYAEYTIGAASGAQNLVLLTVGSGIGTGIILNGKIVRGACGFAGEMGHVSINPMGEPCLCGLRGCLETEVSAARIVQDYHKLTPDRTVHNAEEVCRRAQRQDPHAIESLTRAGHALGKGIAIALNLLNPEMVLLGGGVIQAGALILEPARQKAREHSYPAAFECCSIRAAALGNRAGFMGAALYARDHLFEQAE